MLFVWNVVSKYAMLMVPSSWLARNQLDRHQRSPISPTRKQELYQPSVHKPSKTRSIHWRRLTKRCISLIAPHPTQHQHLTERPSVCNPVRRRLDLPRPSNQTCPRCLKNNRAELESVPSPDSLSRYRALPTHVIRTRELLWRRSESGHGRFQSGTGVERNEVGAKNAVWSTNRWTIRSGEPPKHGLTCVEGLDASECS